MDQPFVTYGLGACWYQDTILHNPKFVTAHGDWPQGARVPSLPVSDGGPSPVTSNCACYYGNSGDTFGRMGFGKYPKVVGANTRHASAFMLKKAVHVQTIMVAVGE